MKTRLLIILLLVLCISNTYAQQLPCWRIMYNNKMLTNSTLQEAKNISLINSKKGSIKIIFNCDKAPNEINRTFIMMDKNRNTFITIKLQDKKNYALVSLRKMFELSNHQPFDIYTTGIPKDSAIAITIRIKPILLTSVFWK